MRMQIFTEIIVVTKPGAPTGAQNEYGDPIYAAGVPTTYRASVEPLDSTEEEITRDTRVQRFHLILPPDVNLDGVSTLTWEGRNLEILGEPSPYRVRGKTTHLEVDAREILG